MRKLEAGVSDEELLRAVEEWVQLLVEKRYQDAYNFLYHPWIPVAPNNDLSAEDIRGSVTNYGWDEPHPDGPFKVTPVEAAMPQEVPPQRDICRYEQPQERAWDSILVQAGGVPSGASIVGSIHFDIPLDNMWSDLTAIFDIVLYNGATVLALESIHVM